MARLEDEYSKEAYQNAIAQVTANKQPQEEFSYDVNADPLYQQYKDQYIQNGKLAMKDTMGQAAALTGGYDSTYSQQVGQQAYDGYLQNLTAMIPELYGQAYSRFATDRDFNFSKQQQVYSNLYNAIGQTGYNPTDAELAAAGMTRAQANAIKAMWDRTYAPVATGGGYYGGSGTKNKTTEEEDETEAQPLTRSQVFNQAKSALASGSITQAQFNQISRQLRQSGH